MSHDCCDATDTFNIGRRTTQPLMTSMTRILLLTLIVFGVSRTSFAAERLDRENLLTFHATPNQVSPVKSVADWQKRRAEIVAGMQMVMGPLPGAEKRVPLDVAIVSETD